MLNYVLVRNEMAKGTSKYIAFVNSVKTLYLEDIIKTMTEEGSIFTRPQAIAYFEKLTETVSRKLKAGYAISTPLFRVRPSITGLFANQADKFDVKRHEIKIRLTAGTRLRNLSPHIHLQKVYVNPKRPIADVFFDTESQQKNSIATSESIGVIYGSLLLFDPSDIEQGVFFVSVKDPTIIIRVNSYATITPSKIYFRIPNLEPGEYRLNVATKSKLGKPLGEGMLHDIITV